MAGSPAHASDLAKSAGKSDTEAVRVVGTRSRSPKAVERYRRTGARAARRDPYYGRHTRGRPPSVLTDGRFLTACDRTSHVEIFHKYRGVVYGVADGKRYVGVPDVWSAPVSADGRTLVLGGLALGLPFLYDLQTGKNVPAKNSRKDDWRGLAHSPDGKTIVYAVPVSLHSDDARLCLVSVPELPEPLVGEGAPTADGFALLWAGWMSDSEFRREYAWKVLAAYPEAAIEYARKQLDPAPAEPAVAGRGVALLEKLRTLKQMIC